MTWSLMPFNAIFYLAVMFLNFPLNTSGKTLPVVLNTWQFTDASDKAYSVMQAGKSALDAVVAGITVCEMKPCAVNPLNPNVGFGGKPNEEGETTLDAMIMDGSKDPLGLRGFIIPPRLTHSSAGVGCLKRIKNAIGVARAVMNYTKHSLLVGDDATKFAKLFGFPEEDLHTNNSYKTWLNWKAKNCQPNFWKPNIPGANESCGPYNIPQRKRRSARLGIIGESNHDTIGMVAIDSNGNLAAGTSTNGLGFKIAGRVGDSPVAGAGSYADNEVGAAAATGNGDVMTRFLPTYQAVEFMRQGHSPSKAAQLALLRIAKRYKDFTGSIIAVNKKGEYGVASYEWTIFKYSVRHPGLTKSEVISDAPFDPSKVKETPCTAVNTNKGNTILPYPYFILFIAVLVMQN
ncbi:N(4)-(Beta-N-acetylglucosaminyl)-L-asparaginase-like isoform X2 [Actinia tenebrosa]|uniref:N(4)-(beta-N-acetylglucosaminyl)-L-asparaginase n=1 Tax=Actinia tenebrosa TaxID=6105 RepID=A0A6P8IC14_ACTTE|nr:N(4)-(Beta-N-acetylglucosaminyl)-L-asparaginase-like isoform X2 [Actinia tenebrosa]